MILCPSLTSIISFLTICKKLWQSRLKNPRLFAPPTFFAKKEYDFVAFCWGRFCNKGRKCENGPNLPLGSLEVFIMENQAQNSKYIMNKRLMVFWQERIKMLITKVQKKHKKITGLKFWPTVTEKKKLRGCEEEKKGSPVPIFPPLRFRIMRMFPSSMGFCFQVSALWEKRGLTDLKLRSIVSEKRKLREVVRKRGKVSLYPYVHP